MKKILIYIVVFNLSILFSSFQYQKFNLIKENPKFQYQQSKEKYIIGRWIMPHNADVNITFYQNGTFIFIDFNLKTYKEETLKGKYLIDNEKLTLLYSDRAKQRFVYCKGKSNDPNYYIKKKGYYFVKEF